MINKIEQRQPITTRRPSGRHNIGEMKMVKVLIELEFGEDNINNNDVYNYLNSLIEYECLKWEVKEDSRALPSVRQVWNRVDD